MASSSLMWDCLVGNAFASHGGLAPLFNTLSTNIDDFELIKDSIGSCLGGNRAVSPLKRSAY